MFLLLVVMLGRPRSDVQCKAVGYPLHSHLSPSLPPPCVTGCHKVPNALYTLVTLPRTVTTYVGVTDRIRSYELNFHPVPHGVPASVTLRGSQFVFGSPGDVFAASSGFVHLFIYITLYGKREKSGGCDV